MTSPGSGLPTPGESADETAIGDVLGFEIVNQLGAFDDLDTVDDLVSAIDTAKAGLPGLAVGADLTAVDNLYSAVDDAVEEGAVPPHEVTAAVAFIIGIGGAAAILAPTTGFDQLKAYFLHYAVEHGHTVTNPSPTTTSPAEPVAPPASVTTTPSPKPVAQLTVGTINVGAPIPEPDSYGGQLVGAAEGTIDRTQVKVQGISPAVARGISLALGQAYENSLTVIVSVLNDIGAQLKTVDADVATLTYRLDNLSDALAAEQRFVTQRLAIDEDRIANTVAGIGTLQNTDTNLQQQITSLATAPPPIVTTAPGGGTTTLSPTDLALIATIPSLATAASVAGLQDEIDGQASEISVIDGQLQTAGIPETPTTMTDLEDCCEENSAVTGPIKAGGATPSSLLGLGSLLSIAGLLGVAASIVSGLAAIFDLDDSITGTFWTAEVISGYAARAANIAIADTSWSRTMAVTVD